MKAVILAAGLGTRLRPLTYVVPKPLLGLGDRTVIEHIIGWLRGYGVREIIIGVHYMERLVKTYLGDGGWLGVKIDYYSYPPSGTAGQLYPLRGRMNDTFAVVYSDTVTNLDLADMVRFHRERGAALTLATAPVEIKLKYGVVESGKDGRVLRWVEKPTLRKDVIIGVFVMEPEVLRHVPPTPYPMNRLVEDLVKHGLPVYAYRSDAEFHDLGTYDEYVELNDKYSREYRAI